MGILLSLKEIEYVRSGNLILSNIDYSIREDEHWVILGPNGSGKSTLVDILSYRTWPTRGTVRYEPAPGSAPVDIKKRLSLFQPARHEFTILHYGMTALEIILTGIDDSLALYNEPDEREIERARSLWSHGFNPLTIPMERPVEFLSSGERRRILLLRSLISTPDCLILDEPYESLDIPSRMRFERLLTQFIHSEVRTSITVLHRIEEIPTFATHALLLKNGRVFTKGKMEDVLTGENLSRLYDWPLRVLRESGRYLTLPGEEV